MNWFKVINETTSYIDDNLQNEINVNDLAEKYFVSYFHFSRIFSAICEVGLSEYIRNRRLSVAANELLITRGNILDIALKYGYNTPEAFTKAFKRFHGVTPQEAINKDVLLVHYPIKSFQIQLKGDSEMNYKIKNVQEQYFLGKSVRSEKTKMKQNIPKLWNDVMNNGGFNIIKPYSIDNRPLGVVYEIDPENESFSYLVGVRLDSPINVEGYETITIPAARFAIFECIDDSDNALQLMKNEIFTTWVSDTASEFIPIAEIEMYYEKPAPSIKGKNITYCISVK